MSVRTIESPWLYLVRQADPDFDRSKRRELAYEFESFGNGRRFHINSLTNGAYGDQRGFIYDENGRVLQDEYGRAITTEL